MKKTIEQVKELLEKNPELRDDDRLLVAEIWSNESHHIYFSGFIHYYIDNKITPESTIRRARRKVQEQHPHLRGEKWLQRHKQQTKVKKELGYDV